MPPAMHSTPHQALHSYITTVSSGMPMMGCSYPNAVALPKPKAHPTKMIFSELYRSPRSTLHKLRNSSPNSTVAEIEKFDTDLISKDKTRQKEAVKRFLKEKVRNDWEFPWPPKVAQSLPKKVVTPETVHEDHETSFPIPSQMKRDSVDMTEVEPTDDVILDKDSGEEADSESDTESVYSTVSEDAIRFKPRAEWTSDMSDDDERKLVSSPYRYDNPDMIASAVQMSILVRKSRWRKAVREESAWNDGLACFTARRDAWTCARTVQVKPKPPTPISPSSPRRLFWRPHRTDSSAPGPMCSSTGASLTRTTTNPLSNQNTQTSDLASITPPPSEPDSSGTIRRISCADSATSHRYPVETLLPIPAPLLPRQTPMRASIGPSIYPSLYDKIVIHNLQPSCPVNLGDMVRACVVGWKRDGEWPPKPVPVAMATPYSRSGSAAAIRQQRPSWTHKKGISADCGRRMSIVGLLHASPKVEEKERDGKDSHSDETSGIMKSLQRVFSLGGHGHGGNHGGNAATSSATHKELTATGQWA